MSLILWSGNHMTFKAFEEILKLQNNKCAICGVDYDVHTSKGKRRFSVDHDHKTGTVRGLLCNQCNVGIGFLLEDERIILNALAYLGYSNFSE